jgi:serine protease Do
MMNVNNLKYSFITTFLLVLSHMPLSVYAASYPDFTEIVEQNMPAVVIVNATRSTNPINNSNQFQTPPGMPDEFNDLFKKFFDERQNQPRKSQPSSGSGFILSSDGYIMTNHHVVVGANKITILTNDKTSYDAELIGSDKRSDLALLKINAKNLPVVKIASQDNVRLGEWVLAIGSPFGFNQTVTAGIVSGKQRKLAGDNYVPYIQTDVAINPGNSGGPLFNLSGEVIGVNAQIYSRTGGFMGVSFAIPSDTVNDVYYQLKTKGKVSRGWLGVYIQEIDDKLAKTFGLDKAKGALVSKIIPNSPAEKARFKQGDVILKFNNTDINKSTDLPLVVGQSKVGKSFQVQILRNKLIRNLSVTLEELPTDEKIASIGSRKVISNSISGISVRNLNPQDMKSLDIKTGVLVTSVDSNLNNNYDVKINDIITKINNTVIKDSDDFTKIMKKAKNNSYVNLLIYRQSSPLFIALKISK